MKTTLYLALVLVVLFFGLKTARSYAAKSMEEAHAKRQAQIERVLAQLEE